MRERLETGGRRLENRKLTTENWHILSFPGSAWERNGERITDN